MLTPQDEAFVVALDASDESSNVQLSDLPTSAQVAVRRMVEGATHESHADLNDPRNKTWSETARLLLHFQLLRRLTKLRYEETPLADVLEMIAWISSNDDELVPFSFARCILIAKLFPSLMAEDDFEGLDGLDVASAAEAIRVSLYPFVRRKVERYPGWMQRAMRLDPDLFIRQLAVRDQWVNEQVKKFFDQPARMREFLHGDDESLAQSYVKDRKLIDKAARLAADAQHWFLDALFSAGPLVRQRMRRDERVLDKAFLISRLEWLRPFLQACPQNVDFLLSKSPMDLGELRKVRQPLPTWFEHELHTCFPDTVDLLLNRPEYINRLNRAAVLNSSGSLF